MVHHTQFTFTCVKSAIETYKSVKYVQSYWHRSGVFIFKFKHIPHLFLVLLLLNLKTKVNIFLIVIQKENSQFFLEALDYLLVVVTFHEKKLLYSFFTLLVF